MERSSTVPANGIMEQSNENPKVTIELKNLKLFLAGSQETICFVADIYVDGEKAGYANNEGIGGPTGYHWYTKRANQRELIEKAEAYCLTLPALHIKMDDEIFDVPMNLEHFIDEIVDKEVEKKEMEKAEKKFAKLMVCNLIFTDAAEGSEVQNYYPISWKGGISKEKKTLQQVLSGSKGIEMVKTVIRQQQEKGRRCINTNLPAEILQ